MFEIERFQKSLPGFHETLASHLNALDEQKDRVKSKGKASKFKNGV